MRALLVSSVLWIGAGALRAFADPSIGEPPEILLGNRLFDETRFAQFFYAHGAADVNAPLAAGDPVMDDTVTTTGALAGPFAGGAMNCRACHLDVEMKGVPGGGGRNYADFARRSPIPQRDDGLSVAARNSQSLLNASLPRPGTFALHFDAEFPSLEALVVGTLVGRNFGWYPEERATAVAHIARVIREDDGSGPLAVVFGGARYAAVLRGTDPLQPINRPVPTNRTVDVARLSDEEILEVVASFVADYVRSLVGTTDPEGAFSASPYDVFLRKNGLPTSPRAGETDAAYSRRLAKLVGKLSDPQFVSEADGDFVLHDQAFVFGSQELAGMRAFFATPRRGRVREADFVNGGTGNCVACHAAPTFSDFLFHNTGESQFEYDAIHGEAAFTALTIPDLETRRGDPGSFLPPSATIPRATGRFRAVPAIDHPGWTDLGLWNVYQNDDIGDAERHRAIGRAICEGLPARTCRQRKRNPARLLEAAVASFKTPGLRDLGHSSPYLHTGRLDELDEVVAFYRETAEITREGRVRNPAHALRGIALVEGDDAAIAAFLRALNEDFE